MKRGMINYMDKKDNNNQFFDVGIKKKERYMWMIICFSMILFIVVVMIKPAVFYNIREVIKTVYYQIIPDAYEERGGNTL